MKKAINRYHHVQAILDAAAGDNTDLYGSSTPFWKLPYEEFLKCEIYGVSMIIPKSEGPEPTSTPKKSDCCCTKDKEDLATPLVRGNETGLIRGLRGEAPFDGKPFARLPWGGEEVSEEDILFIQDWIDDGCPEEEMVRTAELEKDPEAVISCPIETSENVQIYEAERGFSSQADGKRIRMNLDCLDEGQLKTFRNAMRLMYDLNDHPADWRNYNNLALIHQNHCQHAWERFLPWHRVYLYEFERALNDLSGQSFGIPYWDWTLPRYKDGAPDGDIIPKSFKAFLTDESIAQLKRCTDLSASQLKALQKNLVGTLFTSQGDFFEAVEATLEIDPAPYRHAFIDALLASNALWYPLRYPAEYYTTSKDGKREPTTIEKAIGYHYPSARDIEQIQSINNFRDYGGGSKYDNSYGFIDQNPHNTIHIWTGGQNPQWDEQQKGVVVAGRKYHKRVELYSQPQFGDMFSNLTASYDPIFWPHHVNVDRLWSEWQQAHPNANPTDHSSVLTPWNYTVGDTLDHSKFGYEYLKSCYRFPVGIGDPVCRFVSEKVTIPATALKSHHGVEVRLHKVPQLPLSCYIRVFINDRDADVSAPLEDNKHYGGYLTIFGHGQCYGGPGHCDIPPDQAAPYDLREQALHNRPRNHRIDVTSCVDQLIKDGAKEFQVTLVVVGVDGQEMKNFLRLDSVSLNFKD